MDIEQLTQQATENKQRINAIEAETRQTRLELCKEIERIRFDYEKKVDEIWKAIDDLRNRLIYRPTWTVLVIMSLMTGITLSCITFILTKH